MNILGINAYHGDSAACLVIDGKLVAAAEEERFLRVKHWAGFPKEAIAYCLKAGGISMKDVDRIAINRDPNAHLADKALFALKTRPSASAIGQRLQNAVKVRGIAEDVREHFGATAAKVHHIEHHCAHLASAYFISPFDQADVVSVDGFGDFVSTMWGTGERNGIKVRDFIGFPHSLGHFYLSMTQFLGFKNYGDEYKVMGLAAYGKPTELDKLRKVVRLKEKGRFELDLRYFVHHIQGTSMTWNNQAPEIQNGYSPALADLLGPERKPDEPVDDRHKNLAASVQAMYEEAFFHLLNHLQRHTGAENLCLAGGCGMNSLANGRIAARTAYQKVYVHAAPGDAGGAIGAAFYVWNQMLKKERVFAMNHAYWGPDYSDEAIRGVIRGSEQELVRQKCAIEYIDNDTGLCFKTAQSIANGEVVGWFQGRMEWGPRALGNRSILGDPRRADMKNILNLKIKRRESFRPFAPSVLRDQVKDWFETDGDVPFMSQVFQIRAEKRPAIPAVTHVDGSGRLQTVSEAQNPLYYRLINCFNGMTGVPMVLNTSFNENEPVVCRPEEALDCFLRTKMDVLVLGHYFIRRSNE